MIEQWWVWVWTTVDEPSVQAGVGMVLVGVFLLAVILNKT